MSLVKRLPQNVHGRDFVVGDIHGCYDQLLEGLKAVSFDRRVDRLISVGDTVDRGPGSPRAAAFLAHPWVHAIRGNHEDMFLDIYAAGEPDEYTLAYQTRRNGMHWWMDIGLTERRALIKAFRRLPVAMEIETRRGKVGIVHAEVPDDMDWPTFLSRVEAGDDAVIQRALWGRARIMRRDESGVSGVDRVFVGHTPSKKTVRLGNVFYIDTGAVFGVLDQNPHLGRMTLADIDCRSEKLLRAPDFGSFVDARQEAAPVLSSFADEADAAVQQTASRRSA